MNKDFPITNNDINKWNYEAALAFPGISNRKVCARFVLANTNHPAGYGINDGQPAVTVNRTNGNENDQWAGYLNIYVQTDTGALGYATFGGSGNGDGVVIEASAFRAELYNYQNSNFFEKKQNRCNWTICKTGFKKGNFSN